VTVCRDCGRELVEPQPKYRRTRCRDCYNTYKAMIDAKRRAANAPERAVRVGDPVRYLLANVMRLALSDLQAVGRPIPRVWAGTCEDGVTQVPRGTDMDAKDARRWLREFGADWCELMDVPPEWAQQAMEASGGGE
jgi:DNA-directed RNA polymerase subunit RPC12/RpoP